MASSASSESRTRGSSSTIRTVGASPIASTAPRQGQTHRERRAAAGRTLGPDLTAVLLHDLVADRQSEAGAFADRLGREERIEDAPGNVGRNAGPGVTDHDHRRVAVATGLDGDLALAGNGLSRIGQ